MTRNSIILSAALLSLSLALVPAGVAPAQEEGDCLSAREAQQAVESNEIIGLAAALRREGKDNLKPIGNEARLCNVDGTPHWVISVMNDYGDSERIVLNAQAD